MIEDAEAIFGDIDARQEAAKSAPEPPTVHWEHLNDAPEPTPTQPTPEASTCVVQADLLLRIVPTILNGSLDKVLVDELGGFSIDSNSRMLGIDLIQKMTVMRGNPFITDKRTLYTSAPGYIGPVVQIVTTVEMVGERDVTEVRVPNTPTIMGFTGIKPLKMMIL